MSTRAAEQAADGFRPPWTLTVEPSNQDGRGSSPALAGADDRGLAVACLAGRPEAFDIIVERHQGAVYKLCYRFVHSHEDAADLTQEVFLRAYRGLRRFRGESALGTWLYRIGVNVCLNRVSAARPPEVPLDAAPPVAAAGADQASSQMRAQQHARVRAAVSRLPRKQRAAVVLHVYQELTHQEVAAALGTSVGAAKANLFHALGNLKRMLAEEAGESR
jgi:RNA polymerase sigma-70 factor (ECF subfamily)